MAETVQLGTEATAELPDGFKKTELGPLPQEWQVVRLGEVAELRVGRTPPRKDSRYWDGGTIPWVTISDLNNGIVMSTAEKITDIAHEQIFRNKFVPVGTLLLSFKLTVGKVGLLGIPAVHNEAIASVYPGRLVHKDFLFYLFQGYNFEPLLDSYVKGKTLNTEKLKQLPIPLPTPSEQCAIAYVLHIVRQAKEATEKVLAAVRELKTSLMRHLFTYGPVPVEEAERVPLKETEIGPVPPKWEVAAFEDAFVGTARAPKVKRSDYRPVGRVPVIDQGKDFIAGFVDNVEPYQRTLPVIVFGDHTRIFKFVDFPFVVGADGTKVLIPNYDLFEPRFLFYALTRVDLPSRGYNRHFHLLREVSLPLPPLHEQRKIACILQAVDRKIEAEEQRKAALDVLFKTLLHLLMTGRIRVKDLPLPEAEGVSLSASRE